MRRIPVYNHDEQNIPDNSDVITLARMMGASDEQQTRLKHIDDVSAITSMTVSHISRAIYRIGKPNEIYMGIVRIRVNIEL